MVYRDTGTLEADVRAFKREVRSLLTQAPVGFTAVSRGALRILSNEGLLVDGSAKVDGWLIVTGTERVVGRLEGSGTFDWTGPMNLQGAQSVTGPTTFTGKVNINGDVDINGPLDVLGVWKLTGNGSILGDVNVSGNIKVLPGGKIQVGNIIIDPTISGGAITFANGAQVFTDGTTIQVYKGNSVVQISDSYARLQYGGDVISISNSGAQVSVGAVASISGTGTPAGALFQDANGFLRRSDGT